MLVKQCSIFDEYNDEIRYGKLNIKIFIFSYFSSEFIIDITFLNLFIPVSKYLPVYIHICVEAEYNYYNLLYLNLTYITGDRELKGT